MNDKAQLAALGADSEQQATLKDRADRAMEIFERMTPHQMAVLIVDQQDDYLRMVDERDAILAELQQVQVASNTKFTIGDRVHKTKGSRWQGRIVGTYSTSLTPEGYAVESETEHGSVQIYPAAALVLVPQGCEV